MRRKIKAIDPKELFDADDINRTTIKGEMRKLYPAIHQKLSNGNWSARDMVKWLDERGVSMSIELFRVYLNDLDRENGYVRSSNKFAGEAIKSAGANAAKPVPASKPSVQQTVEALVKPAEPGQQKPISGDEIKKSLRGPVNLKQYE